MNLNTGNIFVASLIFIESFVGLLFPYSSFIAQTNIFKVHDINIYIFFYKVNYLHQDKRNLSYFPFMKAHKQDKSEIKEINLERWK